MAKMSEEQFAKLGQPSELLRVVLNDYEEIDRVKHYPAYHCYHLWPGEDYYGEDAKGKCIVCDAGLVMSNTLQGAHSNTLYPSDYSR